ncbi:HK97-gp10 family putative phage morphogenesis protein [Tepidibacillus marianensis]|uniref:HK97-gp10 family putative phage morphogenesis protein n=1 Tax=Tepidibacillus marianensis TaxID=3131995 RepID=UPI0030CD349B
MAKGFRFDDNSKEVKRQLANVSEEALEAALLMLEGRAKALAPVETGQLRDTLGHKLKSNNGEIVGTVGSPLMHALYVEFGTGEFAENGAGRKGGWVYEDADGQFYFTYGQEPQPFLRPAFRRSKKEIEQIIGMKLRSSFKGGK